jgi:hypothetical protein
MLIFAFNFFIIRRNSYFLLNRTWQDRVLTTIVHESVETSEIIIERKNGADGQVSVAFKTAEINAIEDKDFMSTCLIEI